MKVVNLNSGKLSMLKHLNNTKFYKSRNADMPTMLWFPEVLDLAENYDKWLNKTDNKVI